jgi:hypothetical protein
MHAQRTIRLTGVAVVARQLGALAIGVFAACATASALAQGPVLPPTPDQNARRPPMSSPNVLTPEQILKAIGTFPTPQPAAPAPEVQIDVVNQQPAGETLPPPSPFDLPAGTPPPKDLIIPANPGDPEKVVIKESEGQISLLVRDGSLRQVVAMVAETQKLNIVFAGNSDTLVTASFDRQPWQVVLDSLLSASGHTWTTQDDVIFISSMQNAGFLPPGAGGMKVMVYELDFASAADVDLGVQGLLSPAGKSWITETSPVDNRRTREIISVVDYPANLDRISDYVSQTDQPPRQVYIEARILQVELSDECRNGVNFENLASWSSATINLSSVGFANSGASPAFFIEPDGVGLDGIVELLQATQDVKTLATPKIHSVSGQTSHIQIGEKLGYRVTTTTQTSSLESVQMLEVGVVLRVTPRVTRDGRVLMRILPKVSTGSVDQTSGLPSEKTTEVETDILLCSGQGMVLGGLIQEVDSNVQTKIPFLGDIPYAGVLFQRRTVVKSRREIIVTLQPHVLPYSPIVQDQHDLEFMRTVDPLTQGAIFSYPRPYEPSMPDALIKSKQVHCLPCHWHEAPCDPQLAALPPVEPADAELANPAAEGVAILPAAHEETVQPVERR